LFHQPAATFFGADLRQEYANRHTCFSGYLEPGADGHIRIKHSLHYLVFTPKVITKFLPYGHQILAWWRLKSWCLLLVSTKKSKNFDPLEIEQDSKREEDKMSASWLQAKPKDQKREFHEVVSPGLC
jgi:hypothetical protein